MWISEQTAIISLYSINWLVVISETESVYCAVRTECLYGVQVSVCLSVPWTDIALQTLSWYRKFTLHSVSCAFLSIIKFKIFVTVLPSKHSTQPKRSVSPRTSTLPTVHFPSLLPSSLPNVFPCYQPNCTIRTSRRFLGTINTVNIFVFPMLTFWRRNYFLILAHSVYKM